MSRSQHLVQLKTSSQQQGGILEFTAQLSPGGGWFPSSDNNHADFPLWLSSEGVVIIDLQQTQTCKLCADKNESTGMRKDIKRNSAAAELLYL